MSDNSSEERVALVTGGSKGIGLAIAEALVKDGVAVVITGRDQAGLDKAVLGLKEPGGVAYGFRVNASDESEVEACLGYIAEEIGRLDILVNNVGGVRQFAKFDGVTDDDWQEVFDVNLMSMVRFTRHAIPLIKKSKHGRIVNISSAAGKRPGVYNPHYGAVKAGMIHLSKYLANTLGPDKILVNAVCPSTIKGGVWDRDVANQARIDSVDEDEAEIGLLSRVKAKAPLGEIGMPEDVASLVAFLVSDEARFITGTCIAVDGGTINSIF